MSQTAYFFLLGRTPELSMAELVAVVEDLVLKSKEHATVQQVLPQIAQVELPSDEVAEKVFQALGGSLKVMKSEGKFQDLELEKLQEYVVAYLADFDRPTFALAEFGREKSPKIQVTELKQALKERNIGSRFIEGHRDGLSASVLLHKTVIELNLIQVESTLYFARTLGVQDIDDWTCRDREKPYADRKKGMLPPKIARIMVNLSRPSAHSSTHSSAHSAVSAPSASSTSDAPLLYDPFCGTGTVLMEAMLRGYNVAGSDLDDKAIYGCDANLKWFDNMYGTKHTFQLLRADVSSVQPQQLGGLVDAIVTEPFLGKPTPNPTQIPNIFKGLEKMYLGAFKQWTKLLRKGGRVVIIFPAVQMGKKVVSLENMIDKLQQLGYTPLSEPILYHRPQAIVQRQIWIFEFKQPSGK